MNHDKIVCNQKQGIYCNGFKLMMTFEQCVYIEHVGDSSMWTVWVLYGPDLNNLEFMKNINKNGEMFPEAKIKFKGNRMLLRHCPECGGDLRF